MVPTSKYDLEAVVALERLPDTELIPQLPLLLAWLQDMNWPVAPPLAARLRHLGPALADPLVQILRTDDYQWIMWVLVELVPPGSELASILAPEIRELSLRLEDIVDEDAVCLRNSYLAVYPEAQSSF